jgi:hypothetical protein
MISGALFLPGVLAANLLLSPVRTNHSSPALAGWMYLDEL